MQSAAGAGGGLKLRDGGIAQPVAAIQNISARKTAATTER
jgi:hypothetical protein